jgi:hypothetical protein
MKKRSTSSVKIIFMTAALFGFFASAAYSASYISDNYPTADLFLGEKLQDNEAEEANELLKIISQKIHDQYYPGTARRDEHAKANACVVASLTVNENIPKQLKKGIFSQAHTYSTIIRASNSSSDSTAKDIEKDARGFAIKVLGVKGDKIVTDPSHEGVQDFIMFSAPTFFVNSAKVYKKLNDAIDNGNTLDKVKLLPALGFKGTEALVAALSKQIANPIEQRYWSAVPYQLGTGPERIAVKYSVKPCLKGATPIPKDPTRNYLRENLSMTLQNEAVCMDFLIQPRTSNSMSVEDTITEWEESDAPFYPVARITIHKQEFNTAEKNLACENLSFNPWHSLPSHKPLGSVNRIRYSVYQGVSSLRHSMNKVSEGENNE